MGESDYQGAVMRTSSLALLALIWLAAFGSAMAQDPPGATRTRDVIYGRKFGMALTLDVFKPTAKPNGAAIIFVVSGGWVSDNQALNNALIAPFVSEPVKRGYTV